MAKVVNYVSEAFSELKNNVTWSPWSEVQRYTIIVAVFTVVLALATWGVDTAFSEALSGLYKWIKS